MGKKEAAMTTLDSQIAAYEEMRDALEAEHYFKWVVFHGGQFIGSFESFQEAADTAVRRFGRGPYLIRRVGARTKRLPPSVRFRRR